MIKFPNKKYFLRESAYSLCKSALCRKQRGFTLIEVTVTVMLFSILMVVGTGAVLNTNALHQRTQKLRSAVDNLSFIMDDMARNLRTGYNYVCPHNSSTPDCSPGSSISFENQEGNPNDSSDQWVYQIIFEDDRYVIKKSKDNGVSFLTLTVPGIDIDPQRSGFTVIGADPTDDFQPRVIIRLSGTVTYKDIDTTFNLQTTVSQRQLDL